jgi:hypothetical protein
MPTPDPRPQKTSKRKADDNATHASRKRNRVGNEPDEYMRDVMMGERPTMIDSIAKKPNGKYH